MKSLWLEGGNFDVSPKCAFIGIQCMGCHILVTLCSLVAAHTGSGFLTCRVINYTRYEGPSLANQNGWMLRVFNRKLEGNHSIII